MSPASAVSKLPSYCAQGNHVDGYRQMNEKKSSLDDNACLTHEWQFRLLPGVKASGNIHHVLESGALQNATRDHASVAALAVDRYQAVFFNLRQACFEFIQWPP